MGKQEAMVMNGRLQLHVRKIFFIVRIINARIRTQQGCITSVLGDVWVMPRATSFEPSVDIALVGRLDWRLPHVPFTPWESLALQSKAAGSLLEKALGVPLQPMRPRHVMWIPLLFLQDGSRELS